MASAIRLLAANEDIGSILEETLCEHGVPFGHAENLIEPEVQTDVRRLVDLLRHTLSEAEREDIFVVEGDRGSPPRVRNLDEWWRRAESGWFGRALDDHRFSIWFQPIFDTRASEVMAHDCLVRLQDGRVYHQPELIETAIARGELHEFDAAARRLAVESGAKQGSGTFFVAVHAASVYRPERCLSTTISAIRRTGIPSSHFVFTLSEADLIRDAGQARRICDFLHGEGCRTALAQVGAPALPGARIRELRPDFIRIHKDLARNVERPMCASTVRKLVELAEGIGSRVVAEGVESARTMENLWLLGIESMLGFLFGRPAPGIAAFGQDPVGLTRVLDRSEETWPALRN
ncbi:MAG: EAL domain-containing protein [Acidobacteriota bacterium]|nr:EAL domain-containing protein [Acidobacteriota bacterium]